jgi:hypothetical protein
MFVGQRFLEWSEVRAVPSSWRCIGAACDEYRLPRERGVRVGGAGHRAGGGGGQPAGGPRLRPGSQAKPPMALFYNIFSSIFSTLFGR